MHSESRYEQIFSSTIVFSIALIILGFIMDTPANILSGLYRIVTMQDLLITDYVYIAGAGAALVNAGIVTMISVCIIKFSGDPFNGFTIVEMGLMAGFSLFGKNCLNIWPIILGTWLYAKIPAGTVFQVCVRGPAGYRPVSHGQLHGPGQHSCQPAAGPADRDPDRLHPAVPVRLYL